MADAILQVGSCTYHTEQQQLLDADDEELKLRPQSLAVLDLLAGKPNQLVTKEEIFQTVWPDVVVSDDSLVQCIGDIRRAVGDDKYQILQTVPRRGYKLVAEPVVQQATDSGTQFIHASRQQTDSLARPFALLGLGGVVIILAFALVAWLLGSRPESLAEKSAYLQQPAPTEVTPESDMPTLSIAIEQDNGADDFLNALLQELRVAFGRYRSVQLLDGVNADYELRVDAHQQNGQAGQGQVTMTLKKVADASILFAESYPVPASDNPAHQLAIRSAAAIASPGVGAIGQHLLAASRLKPVADLTAAECYAYGFGCTKCSGEEDNVDHRAKACLANMLEKNPNDARAWALQANLYAHQYHFGSTLKEPERSSLPLREHLKQKAIAAANKAEALADGADSSIYWGMAQAYYASCQADKMQAAIQRGLKINPDDPNLLAVFGNWLQYSGRWEYGGELTQRALEIEPGKYKKWWLMGPAKAHYAKDDYEQAYQVFLKSFNERNWLSHLQMAYTLPYLGRVEEAKDSVKNLHRLLPGFTLENALEFYRVFCFDDAYLQKIRTALVQAGLPSRGQLSDDLSIIEPLRPKTLEVNGFTVEYMDVGQGEIVLFVHGSVSDYRTWAHYLLPVSEKHRYISYSQRYFGTQPWPDDGENWSVDTFADDLIAFVEALDVGPVHLVSWSSGGIMTNLAAVKRPELFKSMVNYEPVRNDILDDDPGIEPYRKEWFAKWTPMFEQLKAGDHHSAVEVMIENVFELNPGEYANEAEAAKELTRYNARTLKLRFGEMNQGGTKLTCDYLQQVKTPTRIVLGEKTHKYWELMSKKFAKCTPGADFKILQGTNHKGPIENVQGFTQLILDYVEEHK